MARLIFDKLEIYAATSITGSAAKTLSGITVEGLEISKEANTVEIEDGQTINESFTGSMTIRSVNTSFDTVGGVAGGVVLAYTSHISSDGSVPTACSLKLVGAGGGTSLGFENVYLMGHKDFSNGRVEIVLSATKASLSQGVIDVTTAP